MQQVIRVFQNLLPNFVEHVSTQIVATHIPVYETLPRPQVQMALYNAMHSLGVDLAQGTTSVYANYWREVALQRAEQGISPMHSMLVTNLSTNVMTSQLKQRFGEQPGALAWWLERMHTIISLGMLVMTEARINALRQLGQQPLDSVPQASRPILSPAAEIARQAVVQQSSITIIEPAWIAPAETLRLQTLGQSRVWRGSSEITSWGRKSAQLLLGVLISSRDQWLQREQITELLWPEADPLTAETQFKVALNALTSALEPYRSPRAVSRYVERRGTAYRFNSTLPAIELDVVWFEDWLDQAANASGTQRADLYRRALELYKGDYLSDCLYSDWANETRERLRNRYLSAACALATLSIENRQSAEAIHWAEAALTRDRCWEQAYQVLMQAYALEGNRSLVRRTYERCLSVLNRELGLEPLPETTMAYYAALQTS